MPNVITEQQIEKSYQLSSLVAQSRLTVTAAAALLTDELDMNSSSARDYIMALKAMRIGSVYKRALKISAYEKYLQCFSNEINEVGFRLVLKSVELHLEYYRSTVGGNQPTVRALFKKYLDLLNEPAKLHYANDVNTVAEMFPEGAVKQIMINAYERNPQARSACIMHYGAICQVCEFDFELIYGEIGKNFIHVHHKVDLAQINNVYEVDPINDLIPVCPNCHVMLHTQTPAMGIKTLIELIEGQNNLREQS